METLVLGLVLLITAVLCDDGEVCTNVRDKFYCEHGCCGDNKKERCCSVAGTIVGIVIGVALIIGLIAGLVYCYIKKRGRRGAIVPFGPNRADGPRGDNRGGHLTVIQTTHCYNAGRGRRGVHSSVAGFIPYSDASMPTVKPPLPPAYEPALPPPPPYSAVCGRTATSISSAANYSPAHTTPPVS